MYASPTSQGFALRQSISNAAFIGVSKTSLPPSSISGRWTNDAFLDVRLFVGQLFSTDEINVLSGVNALAAQSQSGGWEILQFANAELIAENTWRLSKLLRGQAGTEVEAESGTAFGSDIILLNAAVVPLVLNGGDIGAELNWQIGPFGSELGGAEFTSATYTPGYRGFQPFRPVHLNVATANAGALTIDWIRRDRLNSDDWGAVEFPMSEDSENYLVSFSNMSGQRIEFPVSEPQAVVTAAQLAASFGSQEQTVSVSVAQISATHGAGPAAEIQTIINRN